MLQEIQASRRALLTLFNQPGLPDEVHRLSPGAASMFAIMLFSPPPLPAAPDTALSSAKACTCAAALDDASLARLTRQAIG